ncbi:uncharacterized protein LOC141622560 isoform X2 [Silene latifolia]|uniref:uncharacterized protein LOC141622560 isoform X2 n=1 Tax=Silene latifolia TaxID=37657 RepID=UPI003D78818E
MGKKQMARRTPPKKNMEGVKMAAAMGGKKKSKEQASVVDDIHVQAGPLKVDKKKTIAEECSKELELGQGSKRKTATSAEMEADLSVSKAVAQKKRASWERGRIGRDIHATIGKRPCILSCLHCHA